MLQKVLKVVSIISQVMLTITAVISLVTAYIIFAPDTLPKPFHIAYQGDSTGTAAGGTGAGTGSGAEAPTPTAEPHAYQPGEGIMLPMSTKIVNLVDPTGRKYIRITIVVEFAPDNPEYQTLTAEEQTAYLTSFQDKLNARLPIMDDTVITLLSTKTYEDLYTADGKEKLRQEIISILSQKMTDLQIIAVYFTEFVVQ